jgi:HD superfamily phosphohydrolase
MMLDLSKPIVVLIGAWNAAIFQPEWMLRHLFDVAEGETKQITIAVAPLEQKTIHYFEGIGIAVFQNRLEFYITEVTDAAHTVLTKTVKAVFEKLPHTPVFAAGLNFNAVEKEDVAAYAQYFEQTEDIDKKFVISSRSIKLTMNVENDVQLNFSKNISADVLAFSFNYHHEQGKLDLFRQLAKEYLTKRADEMKAFLKDFYNVTEMQTYNPLATQIAKPVDAAPVGT